MNDAPNFVIYSIEDYPYYGLNPLFKRYKYKMENSARGLITTLSND